MTAPNTERAMVLSFLRKHVHAANGGRLVELVANAIERGEHVDQSPAPTANDQLGEIHGIVGGLQQPEIATESTKPHSGPWCTRHDKPRELCGPCAREQVRAEQASAVLTAEQLAAIEAREKAATLMPWHRQPSLSIDSCVESVAMSSPMTPSMSADITGDKAREDADFIAHARTDVPRLLAAVKARDEEIARLRAQQGEPAPCPPAASIDDLLTITDATAPMEDRLREVVGLAIGMRDRWCRIAVDLGWLIGSTPMTPGAAVARQLTAIRALVSARPGESTEDAVRGTLEERDARVVDINLLAMEIERQTQELEARTAEQAEMLVALEERDAAVRDIVEYLDANEHIQPFRAVSLWPMWDKIRTLATIMSPQRSEQPTPPPTTSGSTAPR